MFEIPFCVSILFDAPSGSNLGRVPVLAEYSQVTFISRPGNIFLKPGEKGVIPGALFFQEGPITRDYFKFIRKRQFQQIRQHLLSEDFGTAGKSISVANFVSAADLRIKNISVTGAVVIDNVFHFWAYDPGNLISLGD